MKCNAVSFAVSNLLRDNAKFPLSAVQLDVFDAWRRPNELLSTSGPAQARFSTMLAHHRIDLVQDITTDCSVVASLCAATARSERANADVTSHFLKLYHVFLADGIQDHYSQYLPLQHGLEATSDVAQWKVYSSIALQWLPSNRNHRRSSPRLPYFPGVACY